MCWARLKIAWLDDMLERHPLLLFQVTSGILRLASTVCLATSLWCLILGWGFELTLGLDPPEGYTSKLVELVVEGNGSFNWSAWNSRSLESYHLERMIGQKVAVAAEALALAYALFLSLHSLASGIQRKLRWELLGLVSPLFALYICWPVSAAQLWFSSCLWIARKEGRLLDSRSGQCLVESWRLAMWLNLAAGFLLILDGLVYTGGLMESYWEYMQLTPAEYRQYMALQLPPDEQGHDFRADYVERRDVNGEIVAELWTNTRRKVAPKTNCLHPESFPFFHWRLFILCLLNIATILSGWSGGFCQHMDGFGWRHWLKCDIKNPHSGEAGGLPLWAWLGFVEAGEKNLLGQVFAFAFLLFSSLAYFVLFLFAVCACCKIRLCTRLAPPLTCAVLFNVAVAASLELWMGSGRFMDGTSLNFRQPFLDLMAGVAPISPEDYPETWVFSITWCIAAFLAFVALPFIAADFGISWLVWRDWRLKRDYKDELDADKSLENRADDKGKAVGALTAPDEQLQQPTPTPASPSTSSSEQ